MGRSDIDLKLEVIKKILEIVILLITMQHGVLYIAYSLLLITVINQIINAVPNKKLIGYSYVEQIKDILPTLVTAGVMGIGVYFLGFLPINDMFLLFLQIVVGAVLYLGVSDIFKLDAFMYLKRKIANKD